MVTNRNKLSALALSTLVLGTLFVVGAPVVARADNSADWLQNQLSISDGSNMPASPYYPSSVYQGVSMTVPQNADTEASNWLEQQLQLTDGSPTPAFQDRPASAYQGASMTIPQRADAKASKWLEQQLRITDGNTDGQ